MLNGWDLGTRVRGERDHLGVDCEWVGVIWTTI